MSSSKSKAPVHSPDLVYPSLQTHQTTLIILHGRGSAAQKFAEPLYAVSPLPTNASQDPSSNAKKCFRDLFPHTKFVFPTAPLRRAVVFKRSLTHQWFDNWSLTQPELKQHLQIPGLRETSEYLHALLKNEIEAVGAKNIVIMGLSQGCAASIVATLLWKGEPFGGLVGMCGYLPFRKGMEDALNHNTDMLEESGDEVEDMFERDAENSEGGTKFEKATAWLHEELQANSEEHGNSDLSPMQSIPIYMGHGTDDEKVPCEIGRMAADFLKDIDVDVDWKEHEGLGHWYSEEMLRDVAQFLLGLDGWDASMH